MRKGFINLIGLFAVGAFVVASGLVVSLKISNENKISKLTEQIVELQNKPLTFVSKTSELLGAQTGSGSFPTSSLNNFNDGDVVNSGDWNAVERKIGIDNSTNTTSLDYNLRNASSVNPGHLHTTAGISSTIAVAQGGTGTSTLTLNNVILGNGTSSVQFVAPGANGNLLTSNGTTWQSSSTVLLPAGTVVPYVSSTAPSGWLLADGTEYATTTYATLWNLIGYTYGGSTSTFRVPNLNGRFVAGPSSTLSTTLGATGGSTSTQSVTTFTTNNGTFGGGGGSGFVAFGGSSTTTISTASSTPFSIVSPYMILQYIIKF